MEWRNQEVDFVPAVRAKTGKSSSCLTYHFNFSAVAKRHHMVSGTLAQLYSIFQLQLGLSGAAAPIEDEVL